MGGDSISCILCNKLATVHKGNKNNICASMRDKYLYLIVQRKCKVLIGNNLPNLLILATSEIEFSSQHIYFSGSIHFLFYEKFLRISRKLRK